MKSNRYIKLFKYYKEEYGTILSLYKFYKKPSKIKQEIYWELVKKYSDFCNVVDYGVISANSFIFVFIAYDRKNNKLYVETPTKTLVYSEVYCLWVENK